MIKKSFLYPIFISLLASLFWTCSPTKYLPENSYLLKKNNIITSNSDLKTDPIEVFIRQKPNKKTLGIPLHLLIYNKGNNGKENAINKWFKRIGEEPVIVDESLAKKSAKQIEKHLENSGYFGSKVTPEFVYKKKRANVNYRVNTPKPYKIRNYINDIADPTLKLFMNQNIDKTLVKKGDNFDVTTLNAERERITFMLKNKGYYFFSKEYIQMNIDSSLKSKEVDIYLKILNPKNHSHVIQDINNVTIITDYSPSINEYDTLMYEGFYILYKEKLKIIPKTLINSVFIKKGDWYETKKVNKTYTKLASLNIFQFTNVILEPHKNSSKLLDCVIQLTPFERNTISVAAEGTNNAQSFGLGGNISFQNLNTFRGAEILSLKFGAITEWQRNFTSSTNANRFNRNYEITPEINITIPKLFLFPFGNESLSKQALPKTKISSSFSFKQRPDYNRNLSNFNFTWIYQESRFKTHTISPFDFNFVDITNSEAFQAYLDSTNNPFEVESFKDQFISSLKYNFVFNNQEAEKPLKNFSYFKLGLEWSYDAFNQNFSEFTRVEADYRHYININSRSTFVYRLFGGVVDPYNKSIAVPFVKSFFAGGPNGIRAWQARTLGPGSLASNNISSNFEQIGNIQLEFNVEYRFDIIGVVKGAFFTDIGNIWKINPEPNRPGANFGPTFFKELAVGSGIGARLDFDFFIFRLDVAVPIKDPGLPEGQRIQLSNINLKSTVFNLGIGYPF